MASKWTTWTSGKRFRFFAKNLNKSRLQKGWVHYISIPRRHEEHRSVSQCLVSVELLAHVCVMRPSLQVFQMCHASFRHLKASKGSVINISATLHKPATWYQVHSAAAKVRLLRGKHSPYTTGENTKFEQLGWGWGVGWRFEEQIKSFPTIQLPFFLAVIERYVDFGDKIYWAQITVLEVQCVFAKHVLTQCHCPSCTVHAHNACVNLQHDNTLLWTRSTRHECTIHAHTMH